MALVAIVAGFSALSMFAILAFVVGERTRRLQKLEIVDYMGRRMDVLRRGRDQEHERAQVLAQKDKKKEVTMPEIPEDKALSESIKFVKKVAQEAPLVMATAIRSYVAADPRSVQILQERQEREGEGEKKQRSKGGDKKPKG